MMLPTTENEMNNFNVGIMNEMSKEAGLNANMAAGLGINTTVGALVGGLLGGIGNKAVNDGSFMDGAGYGALAGGGLTGLGSSLAMIPVKQIANKAMTAMDDSFDYDAFLKYLDKKQAIADLLVKGGLGLGALGGLGAGLTLGDR